MQTLIIGGGLIGLATAQVLIERGEQVRVIEAREGVGLETSFANGGMLTPSMSEPWNGPGVHRDLAASLLRPSPSMQLRFRAIPSLLSWGIAFLRNSTPDHFSAAIADNYRLAIYSRDKTLSLARKEQFAYDQLDAGTLCVFRSEDEMAERRAINDHLASCGMSFRELCRDEIVATEPLLDDVADQLVGGFWYPDDASGDAHLFCRELARVVVAQGGEIDCNIQVSSIIESNGKVCGVDTNRGRIDADRVVVAAGAHSPALLKPSGHSLAVKPAKGYSLTFNCEGLGALPRAPIVDESSHAVVSPFGERIRVVGTAEFDGFDKSIKRFRLDHLFGVLDGLLPQLASKLSRDDGQAWAGLRPMSSDGRPFVGPTGIAGMYVNAGHGALGWTMAMGSAHLLVDQILHTPTEIDDQPFLPIRH
jgi:D-amino-acid dehydrogenase